MNAPTTDELLKRLNSADTPSALDKYTNDTAKYNLSLSFCDYIDKYLKDSGMTPSELIHNAQIQRNYGYQILNGTKRPGRDKIISLCLALSLSLEEVQRALTLAREGILYAKNTRDSIIIFCINKHMSVIDTNLLLDERGEAILSS